MTPAKTPAKSEDIRVRVAPSPTGPVTVATVRAALPNWLFARKHGGTFVVRIEDTDKERSEEKYTQGIMEVFEWLGLDWDEGPVRDAATGAIGSKGPYGPYLQSHRTDIYRKYLEQLLDERKAYYCYCTKEELDTEKEAMSAQGLPWKYGGRCRSLTEPPEGKSPQTIRFVTPETKVEFTDLVRGKVAYDAGLLGDMVIAKDLDTPLYNFAVVVDDELMKISHVIRGEDHLSNTPKQILFQQALGFSMPQYAHLPIILDKTRSKLSKRTTDVSVLDWRDKGYLPEAVINFIALIGWHPSGNVEVFTREELIDAYDLSRVQKSGAVFLPDKLDWMNREHIKMLSLGELAKLVRPFVDKAGIEVHEPEYLEKVLNVERERLTTLSEFPENARYFFETPEYSANLLVWKDDTPEKTRRILSHLVDLLEKLPPASFNAETIQGALAPLIDSEGKGSVLWPLRVALSGRDRSADPYTLIDLMGPKDSMARLRTARAKLEED
jgi:glutamyl-tRNA synthetase